MIASLPMYMRPSNRDAHDTLWAMIRENLRANDILAPDGLDHTINHVASWRHPDLTLGQICNLPLRAQFRDRVTVIGTADYGLPNCDPGHYNSVFVVRQQSTGRTPQDFAETRFAYNEPMSQSGYGAPMTWAATQGFTLSPHLRTGAHRASIAALIDGHADIAAIDAQTWRMEQADNPDIGQLRVIGSTHQSPGMTFITRIGQDPAPYFDAVDSAIVSLPDAAKDQLQLRGIVRLSAHAYDLPFPPNAI